MDKLIFRFDINLFCVILFYLIKENKMDVTIGMSILSFLFGVCVGAMLILIPEDHND